ncbi:MAG: phosphotransferase, partial [Gammaproteobacteria bacterium]|nr:phosphotransferase [Gammaproteobacteria bacterium]
MGDYSTSKIYDQHAAEILSDLYGIQALASPVHGEIDFNFCIEIDGRAKYLLKISRAGVDKDYLDLQNQILLTLSQDPELNASQVVKDVNGQAISEFTDENEQIRYVRLLTWIEGRLWHTVNPQLDALRYELGYKSGLITKTLLDFDHPKAHRELDWDVAQSLWTKEHTDLFSGEEKRIIESFIGRFETVQKSYQGLRKSVVHNDVNEGNIVVSLDVLKPQVLSIFDFGDALHTQVINDVAIACSYAIKDFPDPLAAALPLLKGYHHAFALQEQELDYLYLLIAMRLIVSITKAAINRVAEPENEYLQVSKQTAIDLLLKWDAIDQEFATYRFRDACGFSAHPDQARFVEWAKQSKFSLSDLYPTVLRNQIHPLELNVASTWLGHVTDFNDLELFDFKIHKLQKQHPDKIIAGGYLEPRALYIAPEYDSVGNSGRRSRTVHLGVDYWLPAYTSVHAVLDGEVVAAVDNSGDKQYGGLLILKHTIEDQHGEFSFFSLYGHLTVSSATQHTIGDQIKQGECIARLGSYPENGNWSPHLHFQLMLSMLDYVNDFAGVAYPEEVGVWASICPD